MESFHLQEYESDFEEYVSDTQIDEEQENSLRSLELEPIVLRTEEKVCVKTYVS